MLQNFKETLHAFKNHCKPPFFGNSNLAQMAKLIHITLPALQAGKMKFSTAQLSMQYTSQAPILPRIITGEMLHQNDLPDQLVQYVQQ